MARLTVVFDTELDPALRHIMLEWWDRPVISANIAQGRYVVDVPDDELWAWKIRYKKLAGVRTVMYECTKETRSDEKEED